MRKLALLIVLMMVIALTSYASDIAVTVSGSVEMTFGIGLNGDTASGFTNSYSSAIDFTLVSGDSEKGKPEDGAVYGWIKVGGWKVAIDDAAWSNDNGTAEAKIMFPGGWVNIKNSNASLNYINVVQDDDGDNDNADQGVNDALANSGGFILGLDFAPVAIELGIFSETDWTVDHNYGANLKATVDLGMIKIEAGGELGLGHTDETIGVGAKLTANIAPLTVYGGLDAKLGEAAPNETQLEFGAGVALDIAGIKVTADMSYNELLDDMDIRAKVDASGLAEGLGLTLTVELFNIAGTASDNDADVMELAVIFDASYNLGTAKPYGKVRYATFDHDDDTDTYGYLADEDSTLSLTLGVELYVIPNVTFVLEYASGDLTEDTVVPAEMDLGVIKFITKIAL
jgi:hypothetical protein